MNDPLPPHGGQLRLIAASLGLRPEDILDFSVNLNPEGPPAGVLAALRDALSRPEALIAYPELDTHTTRTALADHLQLSPDAIVLANGFAPLLEAALRAAPIKHCLLPVPAFAEYRRTLERCRIPVTAWPSMTYDPASLRHAILHAGTDAILLANPQNPTGTLTPAATLAALAAELPHVLFLIDEAFIDYAPEHSLVLAAQTPNLIIFRSVTKFYAIAGLRIAYAVASPALAVRIQQELSPWPVSTLAEHALRAALTDAAYADRARILNARRREQLRQSLIGLGIAVAPAAANFLLLHLPVDASALRADLLRTHHIHVRGCANFEALPGNFIRVAVRDESGNGRLIAALRASLARQPRSPR